MSMILKLTDPSSLIQESFFRRKILIKDPPNFRLMEFLIINFDLKSYDSGKLILIPTQVLFFLSLKSRVIAYFKKNSLNPT